MNYDQLILGLRTLCGFVENGSDTKVSIKQDDATKDWIVTVGKKNSYGRDMQSAIEQAIRDNPVEL